MSVYEQAVKLFKAFHRREPASQEITEINGALPVTCLLVGELDGVIYRTADEPEGHIHRFTKSNRPLLWVTGDGHQMFITKGKYRFTDRGFIS
jgi:hypothetical protein